MSQAWLSLLDLPPSKFPAEFFAYAEESTQDTDPLWHYVIMDPDQQHDAPELPKIRLRMKMVCADGDIYRGEERQ
jgi:hypothetical protein